MLGGPSLLFGVRGEVPRAKARGPKGRERRVESLGSQLPPHQLQGPGSAVSSPEPRPLKGFLAF